MASETAHPKRGEFVYGQGAADDEVRSKNGRARRCRSLLAQKDVLMCPDR